MSKLLLAIPLVLLTGCWRGDAGMADDRVVCDLEGRAHYVRPGMGQVSFVVRQPDSDSLCAALVKGGLGQ